MSRKHTHAAAVAAVALAAAAAALAAASARSAPSATGTLSLNGPVKLSSTALAECPPGAAADAAECRARTGDRLVPGLGKVSEAYVWSYGFGPPTCAPELVRPLGATGRLVVAGKGEIRFAVAPGARCTDLEPVRNEPQEFTITGGTGLYAAASGSGTLERNVSGGVGTERWTGTLVVPGLEFDLTPPAVSGAAARTVRAAAGAASVRVVYTAPTATDAVDGRVPVACTPRSGSRFRVGRTVVTCAAADSSANTARASFAVTVRRTR